MKTFLSFVIVLTLMLTLPIHSYSQSESKGLTRFEKKEVYQCPMHPEVKSDKPGDCPICNMKLMKKKLPSGKTNTEVKESKSTEHSTADKPKARKIKFFRHPMNPSILSNTPAKDEMGMDYVPVYEESSVGGETTSDVEGRASLTITPEQQGNMKLKLTLVQFREFGKELRAPGRMLSQTLAALQVFEQDLGFIQIGNLVQIEVAASPGKMFSGKIASIDSILDPMTRTARVTVSVNSENNFLRAESSVIAKIKGSSRKRLVIPEASVFSTGTEDYVFLSTDGFTYIPKKISLGLKSSGMFEVIDGLKEGDQISEGPNFLIDSESRIQFSVNEAAGSK